MGEGNTLTFVSVSGGWCQWMEFTGLPLVHSIPHSSFKAWAYSKPELDGVMFLNNFNCCFLSTMQQVLEEFDRTDCLASSLSDLGLSPVGGKALTSVFLESFSNAILM